MKSTLVRCRLSGAGGSLTAKSSERLMTNNELKDDEQRTQDGPALHPSARIPVPFARVFCAVELPAEVRARAAGHIERLRDAAGDVRAGWERAEKMHLTLKFLGEIETARVADLSSAAERAVKLVQPFELSLAGAGAFPPRGLPRVLWLGVADATSGLARLRHSLEDECERAGFARERKPFHPHLTIARLRGPSGARRFVALHQEMSFSSDAFKIDELIVLRSQLGPRGSTYMEVSRHRFMTSEA